MLEPLDFPIVKTFFFFLAAADAIPIAALKLSLPLYSSDIYLLLIPTIDLLAEILLLPNKISFLEILDDSLLLF